MKNYLAIFVRGVLMGMADLVPGVSGGTVAFITGIYARLLAAINQIPKQIPLIFRGQIFLFLKNIDAYFLITLLLGISSSIVLFSKPIAYLLDTYPVLLNAFFLGLIAASTLFVCKQNKVWNLSTIFLLFLAFILAYGISTLSMINQSSVSLWYIFFSAALAVCAMILPGISGSFILVLLGVYGLVIDALHTWNLPIIGIFILGALFGLLSFARVVSFLFRKYPSHTLAILTGFLLGSLPKIWPWKNTLSFRINSHGLFVPIETENVLPSFYTQLTQIDLQMGILNKEAYFYQAIALVFIGFFLVFFLEKLANIIKK